MRERREEPKDAARLSTAWRSNENSRYWGAKKWVDTSILSWVFHAIWFIPRLPVIQ